MAVDENVSAYSTTAASNTPAGTDTVGPDLDNHLRDMKKNIRTVFNSLAKTNFTINSQFEVWQRGTSFDSTTTPANNDDTWLADRWLLLSDGNDIVDVSQETSTVPTGSPSAIRLDVETGNAKFGIAQILENRDALKLRGQTVSISFKARVTGSSISEIRAGVASWTSTADVVTSDLVSAWGGAGTNPTLATNWAFDNIPGNLSDLTTSYQTFTIENFTVSASANNVALFIWVDDVTTSVGDFLYITDVQLTISAQAGEFRQRIYAEELALCRRFYERWTEPDNERLGTGWISATNNGRIFVVFDVEKRIDVTMAVSSASHFIVTHTNTSTAVTSVSKNGTGRLAVDLSLGVAGGLTAGEGCGGVIGTSGGWIEFDAEL